MKPFTELYRSSLGAFVQESNRIEGIEVTTDDHIAAHNEFLDRPLSVVSIVELVSTLQPDARFRNTPSAPNVQVGRHIAPRSGPDIQTNLESILTIHDPWEQHNAYETLHPFTDCNGRSGRAIWLHRHYHDQSLDMWALRRGFLHSWYYQTLSRWKSE